MFSKLTFCLCTGDVESLLKMTPWNWKHMNTSIKVDSPITVDVALTSHYKLTGKHLNKFFSKYTLYLVQEKFTRYSLKIFL